MQQTNGIRILNGNMLKLIAAAAMVCDHIGVIIFPRCEVLRIIGRIALPIFAFMISEGAKYTKNRLKYLLTMASFAAAIQIFYYFYSGSLEMSIMVTFSVSIVIIYAFDLFKSALFSKKHGIAIKILSILPFIASIVAASIICRHYDLDYGFYGCILPLFASLPVTPRGEDTTVFKRVDNIPLRVLSLSAGLLLLASANTNVSVRYWAFMAIPLLLLYSGKRGKRKMKYFFYIFYPLHLVIIKGIDMLIDKL